MTTHSPAERLLLKEITDLSLKLRGILRGLNIGALVKLIREQLGMTQHILSQRAKVPQSTISRIEKGLKYPNLNTLNKIFEALFCDLIIVPCLKDSVDNIRYQQAKKIAKKHMEYLKGTMNLEGQQPDFRFIEESLKDEESYLLQNPQANLWEE